MDLGEDGILLFPLALVVSVIIVKPGRLKVRVIAPTTANLAIVRAWLFPEVMLLTFMVDVDGPGVVKDDPAVGGLLQ